MLGRLKKVLGIEGVKVNIIADETHVKNNVVKGLLKFTTQTESRISAFKITFVEIYTRGRRKNKKTDTYTLGILKSDKPIDIIPEEIIEVPFELDYQLLNSEMDRLQEGNFITAGIIKLAKSIKGVKSTFQLQVEVDVKGTKLQPFDSKTIELVDV